MHIVTEKTITKLQQHWSTGTSMRAYPTSVILFSRRSAPESPSIHPGSEFDVRSWVVSQVSTYINIALTYQPLSEPFTSLTLWISSFVIQVVELNPNSSMSTDQFSTAPLVPHLFVPAHSTIEPSIPSVTCIF